MDSDSDSMSGRPIFSRLVRNASEPVLVHSVSDSLKISETNVPGTRMKHHVGNLRLLARSCRNIRESGAGFVLKSESAP